MIVAGFDEAGYGPRLGPLTVAFTAFEVPDPRADLWELLESAVRREGRGDKNKVWVADSKAIKPRKNGVQQLELGVLSFLASVRDLPEDLPGLLTLLGQAPEPCQRASWYGGVAGQSLPALVWPGEVQARAARIAEASARTGVRFAGAGARVLPAARLNERLRETQNKSAVLGEVWVELARQLRAATEGPLVLTVDKHGGRSSYTRLLGSAFPMSPIDIHAEGSKTSAYCVHTQRGEVWVRFQQEAEEASLPAALASMVCKYLREVFMDHFNAWFRGHLPDLKPTAGYAQDAKRFLAEVAETLPRLGVERELLVRAR